VRACASFAGWIAIVIVVGMTCVPFGTRADSQAQASARRGATAVHSGDRLIGEWWTEGRVGRIRFVRHVDGTYRGITSWRAANAPADDSPRTDLHNHNPRLRGRSTLGIVLIWNLTYDDGSYVDGYVYNPRDGDTYRFKAQLLDENTLKIRGYMGIPLLGESQIWKRYVLPGPLPRS
jgi:uncharacterized protein (DUF2147 family)